MSDTYNNIVMSINIVFARVILLYLLPNFICT